MPGPNLTGTGVFGGFINPMYRKYMRSSREAMPLSMALTPQRAGVPGKYGMPTNDSPITSQREDVQQGAPRNVKPKTGSTSIFTRFGYG